MRYDRPFSTYCLHLLGRRLSSYPLCYLQQSRPPHRRLRLKLAGSSNKKGPSSSSCSLPGPRQGQSGSSKLKPSLASASACRGTGAGVRFQEPAIYSTSASRAEASTQHKSALTPPLIPISSSRSTRSPLLPRPLQASRTDISGMLAETAPHQLPTLYHSVVARLPYSYSSCMS